MRFHNEAHSDDFEHHFNAENDKKDEIKELDNGIGFLQAGIFDCEANAITKDGEQDELVEPGVEHNPHDATSESTGRRTATQAEVSEVLRLGLLDHFCRILLLDDRLSKFLIVIRHLFKG